MKHNCTGTNVIPLKRDSERAQTRYDEWLQLRDQALANYHASGSTAPLPKSLTDSPPPRPEAYVEEPMTDLSLDIIANGFDASGSFTLDRSLADDVVPLADPGVDKASVSQIFPRGCSTLHSLMPCA